MAEPGFAAIDHHDRQSWQWLPFATLILLTAIQSLDSEQLEAAEMDGAPVTSKRFFYIVLPHLSRAITIVILIQTIFLLSIFRRDLRHHRRRIWYADADLPDLPACARKPECRAWLRRWRLRHHPRQYRCDLPDAHRRQEPGRVRRTDPWPAQLPRNANDQHHRRLGDRFADLLSDPLDHPHQLQDRSDRRSSQIRRSVLFDWTLENYGVVQERSNYMQAFLWNSDDPRGRLDHPGVDHRGARSLVDGLRAVQAHQGHPAVDALDQDAAGRRRALPDLPAVHQAGASRQPLSAWSSS
jgi:hypothetical protein